jgi:hypothetical protein
MNSPAANNSDTPSTTLIEILRLYGDCRVRLIVGTEGVKERERWGLRGVKMA